MFRPEFHIFLFSNFIPEVKFLFTGSRDIISLKFHKRTELIDKNIKVRILKTVPPYRSANCINIIFLFADNINRKRQFLDLLNYSIFYDLIFPRLFTDVSRSQVYHINFKPDGLKIALGL